MPGPIVVDAADDVTLRTVEREDLDFLHRWRNHPEIRRWMPRGHPVRRPQLEDDFEGYVSDRDDGLHVLACLESADGDREGATRAGFLSLFDEHPVDRSATLSAWVVPPHRDRGVASAALDAMVDHAFGERGLEKLVAGALAANEPSRVTLERAGFREEARVRERYFADGEYVDRVEYGLLADEWRTDGEGES